MTKILALGGCGFIGSYLSRKFLEEGHELTCVDNFSKYGYLEHDFYQHRNFRLLRRDTRSLEPRDYEGYDVVVCLAALIGGIQYFHRIPYQIARDNTQILTHAIDCTLAAAPQATFYYFSSSMVYERVQRPVTEADALRQPVPLTNYGMQKLFGEYVVRGAAQEYGLNYVIVRPFNAVGSGELPHVESSGEVAFGIAHVIPDFVYKALQRRTPFDILGDGRQVRTFTHARDVAEGVALMLRRGIRNEDFNLCGDATFAVAELAQMIWRRVNPDLAWPGLKCLPAPEDDVRFRVGRSEKAARLLGWAPKCNIDVILDDSISFVREKLPAQP
jgi:nucleoside-diphosphate-sugar epimerase